MSVFQSGFLTAGQPIQVATLEFLLIAGGGGGGNFNSADNAFSAAGGGGAGGMLTGSIPFYQQQPAINVTIGLGGLGGAGSGFGGKGNNGFNGENSTFYTYEAIGGGNGGYTAAGSGGSGGGGGVVNGSSTQGGGTGVAGQGNAGGGGTATGTCPGVTCVRRGGGGGAASTGSATLAGNAKPWLDGLKYCSGGNGTNSGAPLIPPDIYNGTGGAGIGDRISRAQSGFAGLCKIRYTGSVALFSGGTTEISGGYVYHSFTSSGVFDYNLYP